MSRIALVSPQNTIDRIVRADSIDPNAGLKADWRWLPVESVKPVPTATQILVGPTYTVEAARVLEAWTAREKTAAELDREKEDFLPPETSLLFKLDFNKENRLRALEGKAAVTVQQYRTALKAML